MAKSLKKRRVSKKNKKSWRKHTDVKDVENFLDDKRLEERLGVSFAELPSEKLFQVDSVPNENDKNGMQLPSKEPKPLKCFEILYARSAVPDPLIKRNRVRSIGERKHPLVKKIEEDRRARGIVKRKEINAKRSRLARAILKKERRPRREFKKDLWDIKVEEENKANPLIQNTDWLTTTTKFHILKQTGKLQKIMPKSILKKTSILPPVEVPHPGMSYNPSHSDHQALLAEVAEAEKKKIKEEEHIDRVTTKLFSRITRQSKENNWLTEMSGGLEKENEKKGEKDLKEDDDGDEYTTVNPPAKNKKKPLKKRRKIKEARKEAVKRREALTEKKKVSDIYKLKFIQQQLDSRERKIAKLQEKRKKMKDYKAKEPKLLSSTKFAPLDLEFNMPSELRGNLRSVLPQGSSLMDRYKSLQKRNVIEPTLPRVRKMKKVKRFKKPSHKMDWEN